jgi:hypothetical protein
VGDGPTYAVTYGGHSVRADAGELPEALRPVLRALDAVIARHG